MNRDDAGPVFAALSDATRRDVLRRLVAGAATATELAAELPITRQAVTKHLSALAEAGLVEASRRGREVRYQLTPAPLGEAVSWIADLDDAWGQRLDALRRHLQRRR
jgi:DNA-binding transcriptional ArsR family regulator